MYHVEFIGIPGSGKSTVRRALLAELKRRGQTNCLASDEAFFLVARKKIDVAYRLVLNSLPRSLARAFAVRIANRSLLQFKAQNEFLARYGEALRIFLSSESFRALSLADREIVLGGFLSAGSMYQVIADGAPEDAAVFFDERFVQKSMMFISDSGYARDSAQLVAEYLRNVPVADFVVYVRVDPASCLKRMRSRPTGLTLRLSTKEDAAVARFVSEASVHIETVAKALSEAPGTTLIEVNNEDSLDETISRLAQMLPQASGLGRVR